MNSDFLFLLCFSLLCFFSFLFLYYLPFSGMHRECIFPCNLRKKIKFQSFTVSSLSDIFYFFRRENSIEWIFVILCKDTQSCFIFNICHHHQGYHTYVPRPMKSFLNFSGIKTYFWPISVKKWRRQMKFLEVKLIRNSGLNRFILTLFINQRN